MIGPPDRSSTEIIMPANDVPHSIAISRAVVVARIERRLHKQNRQLRSYRPLPVSPRKFLVIDVHRQAIVATYLDLEKLAHDLGCLEPWERLQQAAHKTSPLRWRF
jgi:hypothetical protein